MGIVYNKQHVSKDRIISGKGPRDRQIQNSLQNDNLVIATLNEQISLLQKQLLESKASSRWTDDLVNEEIEKALKSELKLIKLEHDKETSILKAEIYSLKEKIKNKDELIQQLKDSQSTGLNLSEDKLSLLIAEATKNIVSGNTTDKSRPQLETIFVDPVENSSNVIETKIEISDISSSKEKINNKLDKLKGIIGKLPSK